MGNKSRQLQTAFWSLAVSLSLMVVLLMLRPDLGESFVVLNHSVGDDRSELEEQIVDVPSVDRNRAIELVSTDEPDRFKPQPQPASIDENLLPATVVPQLKLEPIQTADVEPGIDPDESASAVADAALDERLAALQQTAELLAQAAAGRQADESDRAGRRLENMRQELRLRELEEQLARLKSRAIAAQPVKTAQSGPVTSAAVKRVKSRAGGDGERFSLQIRNAEITEVLEMLGRMTGRSILVGKEVAGTVPSANLEDVTLEEALDGIVRPLGLEFEVQDQFIFVMTAEERRVRTNGAGGADKTAAFKATTRRVVDREAKPGAKNVAPPPLHLPPLPPADSSAENR